MGYSSCLHKPCILSLACLGFSPIDCDQCEIIEEIYQESIGAEDRDSLHSFSRCSALQSTLAALRISILRQRSSSNIHAGSSNGLALTLFSLRHRRIPSPCFSRSSWIQTARPYQGCHRYRTSWDSILWVFDCELVSQFPDSSLLGKGRAGAAKDSGAGVGKNHRNSRSRRAPSSLRTSRGLTTRPTM